MLLRVGAFLLCYGTWAWFAYRLHKASSRATGGIGFMSSLFYNSLLIGSAIAIFPAIHAGKFNLKVAVAFLLISQSALVLTFIMRWLVGVDDHVVMACSRWSGVHLSSSSKGLLFAAIGLTLLAIGGYPIIVIATIFSPTSDPPTFAFKLALITFGLIAVPLTGWVFLNLVSSPYWGEGVRTQLFLTLASGFINLFVFIVLLMWAFGITGTGRTMSVFGVPIEFSSKLLGVTLFGMLAMYFLPHVRGVMWGSRIRKLQLKTRLDILNRTQGILKAPVAATLVNRLDTQLQELTAVVNQAEQEDEILRIGKNLEDPEFKPRKLKIARDAFLTARNFDLRFDQLDWLRGLLPSLAWAKDDLASKENAEQRLTAADRWASLYHLEHERLCREFDQASSSKTPILLFLGFLLSPVIGAFLSKCGEVIWGYLERALT